MGIKRWMWWHMPKIPSLERLRQEDVKPEVQSKVLSRRGKRGGKTDTIPEATHMLRGSAQPESQVKERSMLLGAHEP